MSVVGLKSLDVGPCSELLLLPMIVKKILRPENTSSHKSRHLEFIIEQGHRVNWVSGSLDSRVTGSQNVIQCYVNSLQVANGPASLWASADETANTSPRRVIGPKAAGFPAKSRLQDGRPPFARRPRRRRSLSTTVQMKGTDTFTVASLLRHFALPCLRCPKREEKNMYGGQMSDTQLEGSRY